MTDHTPKTEELKIGDKVKLTPEAAERLGMPRHRRGHVERFGLASILVDWRILGESNLGRHWHAKEDLMQSGPIAGTWRHLGKTTDGKTDVFVAPAGAPPPDYSGFSMAFEKASDPFAPASPRASLLREAENLVTGDRNNQYGPPTQDFQRSADALTALGYTSNGRPLQAHDIAIMVSIVKMSRLQWSPEKRDTWVDLAGYAACGWECASGIEHHNELDAAVASMEEKLP